ncbi:MAG TPA: phosphopantetheine-binding protein, partial [Verrucomicrobiae bacterium]|nr:phosphopantetheine-binding protein [Verrucomicrobiae bacterium]
TGFHKVYATRSMPEGRTNGRTGRMLIPRKRPGELVRSLREYLDQKLPEYMMPSFFVLLAQLPRTTSGKVDRKALPPPEVGRRSDPHEGFVPPRNETEEKLVSVWKEILALERVGIHDNFFELGGHSLLATQVISRVRDSFGINLPLKALFQFPTVAGMARCLEAIRWNSLGSAGTLSDDREEGML